ncbi:MAG TPA: DedA family protein [bacterium]|nr:DedA family protein [bacterium]
MDPAQWLDQLLSLPEGLVYALLFGASWLENIVPPVPGDTVVVFGGYLAGLGRLNLPLTFAMVTLGSWGGFMTYYAIGRWLGHTGVHDRLGRWITPESLRNGEAWVRRYGHWAVLANRMLPGARSVISLTAGFAGLRADVVGVMALLSGVIWSALLVGGGYLIGEQWQRVIAVLRIYNRAALVVGAVVVAAVLLHWWRRRVRARA